MVSQDDIIFVKEEDGSLINLGTGFESKEEIENRIKEIKKRNPGKYTYGVFESFRDISRVEIPEPKTKNQTLTDSLKNKRKSIIKTLQKDNRVDSANEINSASRKRTACINGQNVRYRYQPDFLFELDKNIFDELPISCLDLESGKRIKSIFNEIIGSESTYLGFHSTYAKRGLRDPFIVVYGRINRPYESDLRSILNRDFIVGSYWTDDNISPVPVCYDSEIDRDEYGYRNQDYILVLNRRSDLDEYDLSEEDFEYAKSISEKVAYDSNLSVDWIGLVEYNREFKHICLGVSIQSDKVEADQKDLT